jgi:hypothetical protein
MPTPAENLRIAHEMIERLADSLRRRLHAAVDNGHLVSLEPRTIWVDDLERVNPPHATQLIITVTPPLSLPLWPPATATDPAANPPTDG